MNGTLLDMLDSEKNNILHLNNLLMEVIIGDTGVNKCRKEHSRL